MDSFETFMSGKNWVDELNARLRKKELAKKTASQFWVKPKDLTWEMLEAKWVANIHEIMEWVCMWIQEYYGLSLWELWRTSQEKLINKYGISQKELDTLLDYGDIWLAYATYVKCVLWDKPTESDKALLQTTKDNVIVDESATNAVIQKMREDEKNRLQSLIDNESDPERKELYEAQMKVLKIQEKNWWKN